MEQDLIHAIFPVPVFTAFYQGEEISFLESEFEQIWYLDAGSKSKNHHILDNQLCSNLRSFILDKTQAFSSQAFAWQNCEYKIVQSWISFKNPKESHVSHYHPNSVISGVYFFQDYEPSSGNLNFHRPNILCQLMNQFAPSVDTNKVKQSNFVWSDFNIEPRKNLLVLFPSWLHHSVSVNHSGKVRKSLAFNIIPLTDFGNEYSSTNCNLNHNE